jgi:hypothetical protein
MGDQKLSRECIILIEVLWDVQVGKQIFTLGVVVGRVGVDPKDIYICI